jgi:hypothetical protein
MIIIALSPCFSPEKWTIGKGAATVPETSVYSLRITFVVAALEG